MRTSDALQEVQRDPDGYHAETVRGRSPGQERVLRPGIIDAIYYVRKFKYGGVEPQHPRAVRSWDRALLGGLLPQVRIAHAAFHLQYTSRLISTTR